VAPGTFFSVDAIGALARELPNFLNINLNPATMKSTTLVITDSTGNAAGTNCGRLACGTAIPTAYYVKPYINSHYGSVTEVVSNINSNYNALAIDIENRGNKYAQFDANYTWSHALDYNQNESTSPSTNNWFDPNGNPRANYGNSSFNVPNRLVGWAMFSYPGSATGWQRYLTNGWHFNPIFQAQNGLPYSAGVSGTITGAAGSGINGSASSGYLLQLGRNSQKQPITVVFDSRIQKDLHVSERFNVELLAEAFNLLNYVNVTSVNSTAYSISGTNLKYSPFSPGAGLTGQSGFGAITNANSNFVYSQRQIQLGMKLDF
jgi:hypothetical protein